MELNQDALDKAVQAYFDNDESINSAVADAIKTYLTEILRPGELIVGEPIQPQRDYRKELWIETYAGVNDSECADEAVRNFDKFFGGQQ